MIRLLIPALLAVATTAAAAPCEVHVVHAPDDVRAQIEAAVAAEARCTTSLEVRIVRTEGQLYVFARDGLGITRERLLPDNGTVGALVASWVADDSIDRSIDGIWLPDTLTIRQLSALSARAPGYHDPVLAPVANDGRGLRRTGQVLVAAGLVLAGAGVYYGLQAAEVSDTIASQSPTEPWPSNIHELEDRGQRDERRQLVLLAGGGALAVTGAIVYFVGRSRATEPRIAPVVANGGGGVSLTGSF